MKSKWTCHNSLCSKPGEIVQRNHSQTSNYSPFPLLRQHPMPHRPLRLLRALHLTETHLYVNHLLEKNHANSRTGQKSPLNFTGSCLNVFICAINYHLQSFVVFIPSLTWSKWKRTRPMLKILSTLRGSTEYSHRSWQKEKVRWGGSNRIFTGLYQLFHKLSSGSPVAGCCKCTLWPHPLCPSRSRWMFQVSGKRITVFSRWGMDWFCKHFCKSLLISMNRCTWEKRLLAWVTRPW